MTQPPPWPKSLTATIAGQVQRLRSERKMSAQQLADATAALGHPVARSVIANLESGRRDAVSVAEILVLARALDVPPLLLIFPIGRQPTVEVLPGSHVPTWLAAKWFTGEFGFPTPTGDMEGTTDYVLNAFREQEAAVASWYSAVDGADRARMERLVRVIRENIRGRGLTPPPLPARLAHIDEADRGER